MVVVNKKRKTKNKTETLFLFETKSSQLNLRNQTAMSDVIDSYDCIKLPTAVFWCLPFKLSNLLCYFTVFVRDKNL